MKFRPCIDIHNGLVKQIVGGSLKDDKNKAKENFVSECDGAYYGNLYRKYNLKGGHIILLNPISSKYYESDKCQAMMALKAYRGGLQIGGGINDTNAIEYLEAGASHVIVTSFVFRDGKINFENLEKLVKVVGKDKLVLDLSCKKRELKALSQSEDYYIVTDRWQKFTDTVVNLETLNLLSEYCDEFLIHAVDVEGKAAGIELELVKLLGEYNKNPVTYAGGVSSFEDLKLLRVAGNDRVDVTIGSALDIFGGKLSFKEVVNFCK